MPEYPATLLRTLLLLLIKSNGFFIGKIKIYNYTLIISEKRCFTHNSLIFNSPKHKKQEYSCFFNSSLAIFNMALSQRVSEPTESRQMMKFLLDNKDQKVVAEILSKLWKEYTGKARLGGFGRKSLILSFQRDALSVRFGKRANIKRLKSQRYAKCAPPKK